VVRKLGQGQVSEDLPTIAHFAIGNCIRDAFEKPEIIVKGNGSPIWSYMYQSDLAHWLLILLQHGTAGDAYNVGSDEALVLLIWQIWSGIP
jgi:dTDP-glucose 4,6-dehydratase